MRGPWVLEIACDDVIEHLSARLRNHGLKVMSSFDLQTARQSLKDPTACSCPHHGTADCTCQYIVLLLRRGADHPITLAAHGHDGRTVLTLDSLGTADEIKSLAQSVILELQPVS